MEECFLAYDYTPHRKYQHRSQRHLRGYQLDLTSPAPKDEQDYFTEAAQEQRTTEHVLPQNPRPEDSCWWDHFTVEQHAGLMHSLGNLALTYDNSAYSNRCFEKKRGMPLAPGEDQVTCYAQAPLKQEQLLAQYDVWTPKEIGARQRDLAAWALKRWAVEPPTTAELLDSEVGVVIESEGTDEDVAASADRLALS